MNNLIKKYLTLQRFNKAINCITFKNLKKMKKLVLMAAAIVAVSFASCGNKAANAEQAKADSIRIADSINAAKAAEAEAAAAAQAAQTEEATEQAAETPANADKAE